MHVTISGDDDAGADISDDSGEEDERVKDSDGYDDPKWVSFGTPERLQAETTKPQHVHLYTDIRLRFPN